MGVNKKTIYEVDSLSELFGINVPKDSHVYNKGNSKTYQVSRELTSIESLDDDVNKVLIFDTGWRDLVSELITRGGASAPTLSQFREGIFLYAFPNNTLKEVFTNFHIDHDYKRGSNIYPHMHWSVNTTSTGTVRWGFEYTLALGHSLGSFPTTTIVYVTTTISQNSQYKHFVSEVSDTDSINGTNLEPDTIILMRVFRDRANDTFPDNVFGFTVDLHYQADRYSTKNKSPNFYE